MMKQERPTSSKASAARSFALSSQQVNGVKMAWADEQHAEWDLELQRMRYGFPPVDTTSGHNSSARPPQHNGGHAMDANEFNVTNTGGGLAHAQQNATMTYSASCPSFTALYELSSDDDLIRDIQASGTQQQRASGFVTGNMTTQQAPHHNQHQLQPHLHEHELTTALNGGPMAPHFDANDKSYDFLLQMQQEHLDASMRQYPHQQTHFQGVAPANAAGVDHFALFNQPRRPLHASASFTSLSSMETEYRRQSASKRKKGGERWYKMQRHKSFDSTTTSPATSMEFSAYSGASSQFESTPEHNFLEEVPDADMIGFSIDDFPSTFTSDASWPMPLTLGGGIPFEVYTTSNDAGSALAAASANVGTDNLLEPAPLNLPPHQQQQPVTQASEGDAEDKTNVVENQSTADIDLLLSDQERANMSSLFDAIRDFESPPAATAAVAPPTTTAVATATTANTKKTGKSTKLSTKEKRGSGTKKKIHSPPLHPSRPRASSIDNRAREKSFSLLSSSAPASSSFMNALQKSSKATEPAAITTPDQPQQQQGSSNPLSVQERLQRLLTKLASSNVDDRTQLTEAERTYIESSPLFSPHKASETAGSLWLILHAARCEFGCEIAGCSVMRRVVKHCLNCDVVVGKCRDPCNEAKTMMLHFGSCSGADCGVCHKLTEIDQAHNAIKNSPRMPQQSSPATPSFLSIPMTPQQQQAMAAAAMGRVPIAPHPKFGSSPNLRPLAPSGGASKHVPIQPNPLPTSSNPMGLMGSFPHFGYSLSLYLEQTSAPFRAEVKERVEKRVTSAAGQDLIQHMQKKTRLRSLDDLRSDARTLVLGELERELHFHMQALSWATSNKNNNNSGASPNNSPQLGGLECSLPPYLLSAAASGFVSFYSQQASFHAAMTGMTAAGGSAGAPFSSTPLTSATSTASRRKVSFGTNSLTSTPTSASSTSTSALKSTMTTASEKKADAALTV